MGFVITGDNEDELDGGSIDGDFEGVPVVGNKLGDVVGRLLGTRSVGSLVTGVDVVV